MQGIIRHRALWAAAALMILAGAWTAQAQEKKATASAAKDEVLSGTLIDTKCYTADHNNIGNDHGTMKGCGTTCANEGIPVGLLVGGKKDGRVVILIAPSKSFANYIGQSAKVSGTAMLGRDALVPTKVEVKQEDGSYKAIDISAMM